MNVDTWTFEVDNYTFDPDSAPYKVTAQLYRISDINFRIRYLSEEGIAQCTAGGKGDADSIIRSALNTDLKEIGAQWLPDDINRGRADYVQGPGVLQLQKIRNVSAPKDNEESQAAPRLMKLVLTDGHVTCSAVETEMLKDIGSNTTPGSKILLKMTVGVEHGFLLLNNKNSKNLGGRVDKMAESWELKKKLAKQLRSGFTTDGGPPTFVPFGQRIGSDTYKSSSASSARRDNFKSLETSKAEKKVEDDEFAQQRKATIAEAMQAKEDGQSKKFGGGQKQVSNDFDVAKITEMGFRAEEATYALKMNNGNMQQAIDFLLKGGGSRDRRPGAGYNRQPGYDSFDRRQGRPNRPSGYESDRKPQGVTNRQSSYESDRGRGRKDRRDEDTGPPRGRRGRDQDEGQDVSSKPSGPATLFDFLAVSNKIPDTKDSSEKGSSGTDSSNKTHAENRERHRTSSGSSDHSNRSKQNVPPRFVNKSKHEQTQRNQNHYQDDRSEKSQRFRDDKPKSVPSENRRYDSRTNNERSVNERERNNNRNRNYNDRNYDDGRDFRRGGGRNDDRNYNQNDTRKTSAYDSKSNSNSSQRYSDDRGFSRGNSKPEKPSNRDTDQTSDRLQNSSDSKNKTSSRTSYNNDREEQGRSRNYQGQSSQSHQNQSSANNSYKKDSYSKGDNSQKSQTGYSANSRGSNSRNVNGGGDNCVQSQQTQSSNYRNYNNYPPMSSSGGQFQSSPEYVYTEAQQPVPFNIKVGDKVMAKYWEDNLFYEAMIEVMAPNMPTVVVTFTEYGNTEEVMLTDIRPCITQMMSPQGPVLPPDMSIPPPQVFYQAPPPPVPANVDNVIQAFAGMEFRRGGGGSAYPRKDNRGQQQYYQPPPQRR